MFIHRYMIQLRLYFIHYIKCNFYFLPHPSKLHSTKFYKCQPDEFIFTYSKPEKRKKNWIIDILYRNYSRLELAEKTANHHSFHGSNLPIISKLINTNKMGAKTNNSCAERHLTLHYILHFYICSITFCYKERQLQWQLKHSNLSSEGQQTYILITTASFILCMCSFFLE